MASSHSKAFGERAWRGIQRRMRQPIARGFRQGQARLCAVAGVTTLAGRRCHFSDSVSKLTKDGESKFAIFGAENSGKVDLHDFLSEARRACSHMAT